LTGKHKLYRNLKTLMEHGKIKYPKNDKMIQQMANLIETHITMGTRIQPPLGRHDDFPDALALSFKNMKVESDVEEEFFIFLMNLDRFIKNKGGI